MKTTKVVSVYLEEWTMAGNNYTVETTGIVMIRENASREKVKRMYLATKKRVWRMRKWLRDEWH